MNCATGWLSQNLYDALGSSRRTASSALSALERLGVIATGGPDPLEFPADPFSAPLGPPDMAAADRKSNKINATYCVLHPLAPPPTPTANSSGLVQSASMLRNRNPLPGTRSSMLLTSTTKFSS